MKKIILLLGIFLLSINSSFGAKCEYQCVQPYDMNNKISSFFSSVTGLNFLRTKITESVIKNTLIDVTQGNKKIKVNIDSYSAKDLANGIFKSLNLSGNDIIINDIYISAIELKSLCDFNYIKYDRKGNVAFKEDFPLSFYLVMSASDISNTMHSDKYKKVINHLNKFSFAGIKVSSADVSIRGNKFYYTIYVSIPFMREQKVELAADLKVKNGEIDFENTRLSSNSFKIDLKKANSIIKHLNPLDFSMNIFDNKNAKITIKNIEIKNNEIHTDGIIVIPKD